MNTRKRKALSPVVASIILIAVTVAVSIAVAAWMGALSFNFMNTEQGQITYMTVDATNGITATFKNSGTTAITIESVYVNNVAVTSGITLTVGSTSAAFGDAIPGNTIAYFGIPTTYVAGNQYEVKMVSAAGHTFSSTVTAPV